MQIDQNDIDEALFNAAQVGLSDKRRTPSEQIIRKIRQRIAAFLQQMPYDMTVQEVLEKVETEG